jgi:hypothetical protein
MAIVGAHVLLYTPEPEAVRGLLEDAFGWSHVDTGGGWLIFALPPSELGVHPAELPSHELTLMCDDLETTTAELRAKGVEFPGGTSEQSWGVTTTMVLPGGLEMTLYEPRHTTAI